MQRILKIKSLKLKFEIFNQISVLTPINIFNIDFIASSKKLHQKYKIIFLQCCHLVKNNTSYKILQYITKSLHYTKLKNLLHRSIINT